jgi:hypothetical protein
VAAVQKNTSRAERALRMAASMLYRSQSALGHFQDAGTTESIRNA